MKKNTKAPKHLKALYKEWRHPRFGTSNPENLTNEVWAWMAETKAWPLEAHRQIGKGKQKYPGWCFDRFGQSETKLADGSVVFIAGEHEDHYDPDFYIYNDVAVKAPDGAFSFYGYPHEIFPPTDHHSATLVGHEVYIIGCLGYPEQRDAEVTPVYVLDTNDYSIRPFKTKGPSPRWMSAHSAELSADGSAIICEGGRVSHAPTNEVAENLVVWRLYLNSGQWSRVSEKKWTRWKLVRTDGERNDLWNIGQLDWAEQLNDGGKWGKEQERQAREEFSEKGHLPDLELYRARYVPPLEHKPLPEDEDEFDVKRISVDGITVRYDEDMYEIVVTVEGQLAEEKIAILQSHGIETFTALDGAPYEVIEF